MRDPWHDSDLARRFADHARTADLRAPLNAALCSVIARTASLSGLLGHASPTQQLPVLMLAAIHHLVLDEPEHPLASWYPNIHVDHRAPTDPELGPTLIRFVDEHELAVTELVATRRVQTNEVGRCALFLPVFSAIAEECGPIAHLDVGASGGLNLLLPHFAYRYDDHPPVGASAVELACGTRGSGPIPTAIPDCTARCGIDSRPVDVTDPVEARWLEACCWPDQADRFRRLRAAIAIARAHPPELLVGDAVDSLASIVERLSPQGHPTITTSWVLNYLPGDRRQAFVDTVDRIGATTDLSWVLAESPALTPELPHPTDLAGDQTTALTVVRWRGGRRTVQHLATCHPHGYWIHWR